MKKIWCLSNFSIILGLCVYLSGCCQIPPYSPGYWNDAGLIQSWNNCYNYGNNKRTDTYAQPGRAAGAQYPRPITCNGVYNAAIDDGLDMVQASGDCPSGYFKKTDKLALVVAPGSSFNDFHWYRLGTDGKWSHKPGGGRATDLDNSGNPISNPQTANRGLYTDFCGYLCSCSDDGQGKGHENIR